MDRCHFGISPAFRAAERRACSTTILMGLGSREESHDALPDEIKMRLRGLDLEVRTWVHRAYVEAEADASCPIMSPHAKRSTNAAAIFASTK